jgi:hypothetical protein
MLRALFSRGVVRIRRTIFPKSASDEPLPIGSRAQLRSSALNVSSD